MRMIQHRFLAPLVLGVGLLALGGCKSDTAKDAAGSDPVQVLSAGAAPQAPLRYAIPRGTVTRSTMEIGMAELATTQEGEAVVIPPRLRFHIVAGPTFEGTGKTTRFDVRIVKAEAVAPQGTDPAVQLEMNRAVSVLNNVGGWVEIDDRGMIRRSNLNSAAKDPAVPARLLLMLINARTSLARVVFPAQPVGIGASWETRKKLSFYGFEVDQVDKYTLTQREGNQAQLEIEVVQTAPAQTITFEEQGIALSLESLSMSAQGQVTLNVNALESISSATGQAAEVLNVKTVDGSESIELNSAFDVNTTVTGNSVEPLPTAGDKS